MSQGSGLRAPPCQVGPPRGQRQGPAPESSARVQRQGASANGASAKGPAPRGQRQGASAKGASQNN